MPMRRFIIPLSLLLFVGLLSLSTLPAAAQSAKSIVETMKARHQDQLKNVENYVVETSMYTSYHRKVMKDGTPALETETKLKGEKSPFFTMDNAPTTTSSDPEYYNDLSQNATYAGSQTINGVQCHVLRVEDASEMKGNAEQMTYYVDEERYVPVRVKTIQPPQQGGGKPTEVVTNFEDYRTTKGVTLPWRTTMQMKMDMSKKQRQQMKKMMKQLENLPEAQRERMKEQMPMSLERMQKIMGGEPMTIEITEVRVNTDIPEGVFNSSGSGQ